MVLNSMMGLNGLDDATATLILQLESRDLDEMCAASKGKGIEPSDAEMAMAAYGDELKATYKVIQDRVMARSVTRAVLADADVVQECMNEENVAADDRNIAFRLGGIQVPPVDAVPHQTLPIAVPNDNSLDILEVLYVADGMGSGEASASASTSRSVNGYGGVYPTSPAAKRTQECISCSAEKLVHGLFQSPCGHAYCQECIRALFANSITDEALFPPRCCRQPLPLESAKPYLGGAFIREFEKKTLEFESTNRTYCAHPTCSSFICPVNIEEEVAGCPDCGTTTCVLCKSFSHGGDCPNDTATQQVLETARQEGWQRCYSCRRVIELNIGCNHITYVRHCFSYFPFSIFRCLINRFYTATNVSIDAHAVRSSGELFSNRYLPNLSL